MARLVVELVANHVTAKREVMTATQDIYIIGYLIGVGVEVRRRAGTAARGEFAGNRYHQPVREIRIHVHAELGGTDVIRRRTARNSQPRPGDMGGIEYGGTDRVGVAQHHRVIAVNHSAFGSNQNIPSERGGTFIIRQEVTPKESMLGAQGPIHSADVLIFPGGHRNCIGHPAAGITGEGHVFEQV